MKFGSVHDIKNPGHSNSVFCASFLGKNWPEKFNIGDSISVKLFQTLKNSRFGMGITRSITWKFLLFCFKKKKFEEKQYEEFKLHKQCSLQPPPRLPFFWKSYLPLTIITTPLFMINLKRKNLTKFFNLDAIFGLLWVTFLIPFLR